MFTMLKWFFARLLAVLWAQLWKHLTNAMRISRCKSYFRIVLIFLTEVFCVAVSLTYLNSLLKCGILPVECPRVVNFSRNSICRSLPSNPERPWLLTMLLSFPFFSLDNNYVLHCNQEVFGRNASLCKDSSHYNLCVRCSLWPVVFYGCFRSADRTAIQQGKWTISTSSIIHPVCPPNLLSIVTTVCRKKN